LFKAIWMQKIKKLLIVCLNAFPFLGFSFAASASVTFPATLSACNTNKVSTANYQIQLCIDVPEDGTTVMGVAMVEASAVPSDDAPGIAKLVFYLDTEYLLTDYIAPYSFEIPTDHFVDGTHNLSVKVEFTDNLVSQDASIDLVFNNGVTEPPVNANTFTPYTGSPPQPGQPFVVAAVGDGASGIWPQVPDLIASWNPDMFLYIGDVYERGTYTEFYNWYGTETRSFGQFRRITNPTLADHEYATDRGAGYFEYWDNVPPYYSFNAAGWHFVVLNSVDRFEVGKSQYEWLAEDLSNNTSPCVIATLHHPIFSIGSHGPTERIAHIWPLFAEHGVDIVLDGNEHNYQRWQPLDANGNVDAQGVTEFVVGMGGRNVRQFTSSDDRVAYGYDTSPSALGALRMELNPDGLTFMYINIEGQLLDSGAISCDGGRDTTAPTTPMNLVGSTDTSGAAIVTWEGANDNTGIAGYTIYRDDVAIDKTAAGSQSFTDFSAQLGTTYTYAIDAFDPSGNHSALSNDVTITMPSSGTTVLQAVADAYVNEEEVTRNFGNHRTLRTDSSPVIRSYLRFNVPNLGSPIVSATLRVYANSASSEGYSVYSTDGGWDEQTINFTNTPTMNTEVVNSGGFSENTWTTADVTGLINGASEVNLVLTSSQNTAISFSSHEGDNPPELVIVTGTENAASERDVGEQFVPDATMEIEEVSPEAPQTN
jgi:hypothetical protein